MVVQVLDCDRHKYAAELNLLYMALWLCFNSIVFKHCLFHIVLNWTLNVLVGGFFFIIISFPEYGKREAHMSYLMSITVTMKYIQISIVCQELPVHMYMSVMWQHGIPVWSQLMINSGGMFLSSTFFSIAFKHFCLSCSKFSTTKVFFDVVPFLLTIFILFKIDFSQYLDSSMPPPLSKSKLRSRVKRCFYQQRVQWLYLSHNLLPGWFFFINAWTFPSSSSPRRDFFAAFTGH